MLDLEPDGLVSPLHYHSTVLVEPGVPPFYAQAQSNGSKPLCRGPRQLWRLCAISFSSLDAIVQELTNIDRARFARPQTNTAQTSTFVGCLSTRWLKRSAEAAAQRNDTRPSSFGPYGSLVASHYIYVYGSLFVAFRGYGHRFRLATPVVNNGRNETGWDLTDRPIGIRVRRLVIWILVIRGIVIRAKRTHQRSAITESVSVRKQRSIQGGGTEAG
jgi:hypothetical protein